MKERAPPTPGPWYADNHGQIRRSLDHVLIAELADDYGNPYAESRSVMEANSRLVAAAPEMLDALEYALTECGDVWIDNAKAAVAKANGGAA
jgi:hypothetical protein